MGLGCARSPTRLAGGLRDLLLMNRVYEARITRGAQTVYTASKTYGAQTKGTEPLGPLQIKTIAI
jgi:hypothetical protein